MDPPLALSIAFRRGWQWPFREGDTLRVYAPDGDLLAELPARFGSWSSSTTPSWGTRSRPPW
jgi:hypothetical protein